jgi:sugar phosphate isomerase/epimerase
VAAAAVSSSATTDSPPLTLWGPSVLPLSFADRIVAAQAGGFSSTSLIPFELRRAEAAGQSLREIRAQFEDGGVAIRVVDPLARWLPNWTAPLGVGEDDPVVGGYAPGEIFELCDALGADLVTALALFVPRVDPDEGAELFAAVCDEAAEHGVRMQLEFIPGSGIPELALAWEIVRLAGRKNGGLIVDSWHFFRSIPDYELLAAIPPERIFAVQIEDAPAAPAENVAVESLHGRLVPGEGELDLERFVASLPAATHERLVGPEVFSDELWQLPPAEIGQRLSESMRALLA